MLLFLKVLWHVAKETEMNPIRLRRLPSAGVASPQSTFAHTLPRVSKVAPPVPAHSDTFHIKTPEGKSERAGPSKRESVRTGIAQIASDGAAPR